MWECERVTKDCGLGRNINDLTGEVANCGERERSNEARQVSGLSKSHTRTTPSESPVAKRSSEGWRPIAVTDDAAFCESTSSCRSFPAVKSQTCRSRISASNLKRLGEMIYLHCASIVAWDRPLTIGTEFTNTDRCRMPDVSLKKSWKLDKYSTKFDTFMHSFLRVSHSFNWVPVADAR